MRPRAAAARRPVNYGRSGTGRRHRPDYILVLLSILLLVVGLIVVYAISPGLAVQRNVSDNYYISKQAVAILIGFVAFIVAANVPLTVWQRLRNPLVVAAGIVTLIALFQPVTPEYPAHRWIRLGGLSLQAVELIKYALIFWLAHFLVARREEGALSHAEKTFKPLFFILGGIGLVVAVLQSDLGSAVVLVAMMGMMSFVAGVPMRRILLIGAVTAAGIVLAISGSAYRRERFLTFLNPERDCVNAGYQACQALITVGSGGMFGKGLAHSVQAYGYLPEAANDSIFAILAEKFGFVGVTSLLVLFTVFFTRVKNIMERAPDMYSRLVATGVLAWLSTQALMNIGAMIGLLPLKGITLPFISYGGTSIILVMAGVGLLFNISRYTTYGVNTELEGGSYENSAYRGRVRRPHYAAVSRRP